MTETMAPIFIISGAPGAGKSTVSIALLQKFSRGIHIPVDELREWVVSGIAQPIPVWSEETTRQFNLAREGAARLARLYARAGFAVAIDDVLFEDDARQAYLPFLEGCPVYKVLLLPELTRAQERNRSRTNKAFDTRLLQDTIREIDAALRRQELSENWLVLDSSELDAGQTAQAILENTPAARF